MRLRQILGASMPAGHHGRPACEPFQTVRVEGTDAREPDIARIALDAYVAHFRMKQPLERAIGHDDSATDPRSYRHVGQRAEAGTGTQPRLRECSRVDISIDHDGAAEALQRGHHAEIGPSGLGSREDPPPGGRAGVEIYRPERGDADAGELTVFAPDPLEEFHDGRERRAWGRCGYHGPTVVGNLLGSITGGTYDLGATGLDRTIQGLHRHTRPRLMGSLAWPAWQCSRDPRREIAMVVRLRAIIRARPPTNDPAPLELAERPKWHMLGRATGMPCMRTRELPRSAGMSRTRKNPWSSSGQPVCALRIPSSTSAAVLPSWSMSSSQWATATSASSRSEERRVGK